MIMNRMPWRIRNWREALVVAVVFVSLLAFAVWVVQGPSESDDLSELSLTRVGHAMGGIWNS